MFKRRIIFRIFRDIRALILLLYKIFMARSENTGDNIYFLAQNLGDGIVFGIMEEKILFQL